MSEYSTSLPVRSDTRLCLMRAPVPAWNSWKCTSLAATALKSWTGTFTSPKLREPFQIDLGIAPFYPETVRA